MTVTLLVLPSKPVGETVPVTFNFLDLLAFGESITGATVAATVFSGTDSTPDDILSGLPVKSQVDVVQIVTGGVAGVIYEITCAVTTSDSNVLVKSGRLAVITAGGLFGV
jgi:hypothetical protein